MKRKKPLFARWWFILLVIIVVLAAVGKVRGMLEQRGEPLHWSQLRMGDVLPEPVPARGEVHTDTEDELWVDVFKTSKQQYDDYMDACKGQGFTVDGDQSGIGYSAYDEAGYKLELSYYESGEEMSIQLTPPMEMGQIQWPASELGALIPLPQSAVGKTAWEREDGFFLYVGQTTREDYAAYVTACADRGFTVDYEKGEEYYRADDGTGHHLSLQYEGHDTMSIRLEREEDVPAPTDAPAEAAPEQASADTEQPEAEQTAGEGIRPEFKQAMDSYEAFFDEYIEFMQSYQQSGNALEMLAEYADYMSRYTDAMANMDALGEEEMSNEELLYYTAVTSRINQKLLAAALETE